MCPDLGSNTGERNLHPPHRPGERRPNDPGRRTVGQWLALSILLDHETFATGAEAIAAIADYIDNFYSVQSMNSSIGYISPIRHKF